MEKILKVDFWKSLKFTTKTDGLEFVKTQPELESKFQNLEYKLESTLDELKSEFFQVWEIDHIKKAKIEFLNKAKEQRKFKKTKKDKDIAKTEAKAELILDDYLEYLPSGWDDDPVVKKIYMDLALSKTIIKVKTSTLELLKSRIEAKWKAEQDLESLVTKLSNFS